jgi:uncharacterized integral membrane protein
VLAHGLREPSRLWDTLHAVGGVGGGSSSRAGRRSGRATDTLASWWVRGPPPVHRLRPVDEQKRTSPQSIPQSEQPAGEPKPTETASGNVRHTRISGAWTAVVVAAVLGVALIVFIVQNTQKVQVKFFGASGHLPLVVTLLAAAIVGALVVLVVGISRVTQLRLSARRRSKRTKEAENYPSSP